jgi:hypothetical protein
MCECECGVDLLPNAENECKSIYLFYLFFIPTQIPYSCAMLNLIKPFEPNWVEGGRGDGWMMLS